MEELSYKINNGIIDITYFMNEVCECISQIDKNLGTYIDHIIEKYDIKFDDSLNKFVDLCTKNNIETYILSGGFNI